MFHKQIAYDRQSKDFAAFLDNELIGYFPSYLAAENALNEQAHQLLTSGILPKAA